MLAVFHKLFIRSILSGTYLYTTQYESSYTYDFSFRILRPRSTANARALAFESSPLRSLRPRNFTGEEKAQNNSQITPKELASPNCYDTQPALRWVYGLGVLRYERVGRSNSVIRARLLTGRKPNGT
jgi:hypothetical protein